MQYTNDKLPSCSISSDYINGAKLNYTYTIFDAALLKDYNSTKDEKYMAMKSMEIKFIDDIIRQNKCFYNR